MLTPSQCHHHTHSHQGFTDNLAAARAYFELHGTMAAHGTRPPRTSPWDSG
ncbi:hypothetical protein GCM10010347_43080 [Streptomyces cirratus]|uniref:Uncharacterized protein n=1 Tax=Streptomyces cirratus TaxID=68187 RepID=A0ABQ3EWA9_9ACTN|nr:hypothetical protein GCM10010347_43080 [Streptomyces cirratus]